MRFLTRSIVGLMLFLATLALLGLAFATVRGALVEREAGAGRSGAGNERIFTVGAARLEPGTVRPILTAYGELRSAVQLELRAASEGRLIELAADFEDGGEISEGEVLFRIDPGEFETERALAASDLEDARAELADARTELALVRDELAAAERQQDLRRRALTRAEDLRGRGVTTAAELETIELALIEADQALASLRLTASQAESRINRAAIAERRAIVARDEAARNLANTVLEAPFDGVLSEVNAVLGRRVSANEMLGLLIDPAELEVAFRVSNQEYARLTDSAGALLPLEMTASLRLGETEIAVPGRIDRAGATAGAGQSGRLIYARLDPEVPQLLRAGDFLTVRIPEPPLTDVASVPAAAVDPNGRILLLDGENRLEAAHVAILRRIGDEVVIADAPFGRTYVTVRLPQLGPGVRVRPILPGEAEETSAVTGAASAASAAADPPVQLTPDQKARLTARIEADASIPPELKARMLSVLAAGEVPQDLIDRIESGARGG